MNTENRYQETDLGNVSPNPRGEYTPGTEYEYLDLVTFDGGSYICTAELGTTTSISPESGKTTDFWQCMTIPGDMTPEYVAMHDRVVNLSEQVEADAEEVRTAEQNVSEMKENVTQMQEQTRQSAESAERSKDSAAGYAASADASRQAAETSEQNINAQVTGFDAHVDEKTSESNQIIEAARIAANKAILAQQEQSVNEVARVGGTAVSTAQAAAQTATEKAQAAATSEKNAAASETAAKLSEENATKMAEQVATDKEQVAYDRTAVENAKQEMTESVAQIEQNTQGITELKGDLAELKYIPNDGNFFDFEKRLVGKDINSGTGIITDNPSYWVSDKIVMDFTKPIIVGGGAYTWIYCFTNDTSISGYKTGYYGRVNAQNGVVISNTYPNTEYIRVADKAENDKIMVTYGNDATYKAYNLIEGHIEKSYFVDSINKKIGDTIRRNSDKESFVTGISYSDSFQENGHPVRHKYLTLLHLSDTHGNQKTTKNAVSFSNNYENIDAIIHTGDYQHTDFFTDATENGFVDTVQPHALKSTKPFLPVIGNHDVGNHNVAPCTNKNVYNRYIKPLLPVMGLSYSLDENYYYKDFIDYKIRLIVLNEYDTPRELVDGSTSTYRADMWKRFINQNQANWFVETLHSLPNDWSVIVALHQLVGEPDISTINPNIFCYDKAIKGWKLNDGSWKSNQDNNLIPDIVDAFISKTTLSKTYSPLADSGVTSGYRVTVDADFTNRTDSNFICFLSGHTHMDIVGYVKGMTNNVLNISINDSGICDESVDSDLPRLDNTKSEDCFNVIAFDTDYKTIKIVRVGADMVSSRENYGSGDYIGDVRRRDFATYKY